MANLFSSFSSMWAKRQSFAKPRTEPEPDAETDVDWEPAVTAMPSHAEREKQIYTADSRQQPPTPNKARHLGQLEIKEIRRTQGALDAQMQDIFTELHKNRANQESLLKEYEAATDEATRRTLARHYAYVKAKECQLEERHEELGMQLHLWDSVGIQVEKAQWHEGSLDKTKQPVTDLAILQSMMQSTIAHGEQYQQQVRETLDMVDAAALKAKARRDYGVQATMAEMDQQLASQREAKALAQQHALADLANGVDAMLNTPLAAKQNSRVKEGV